MKRFASTRLVVWLCVGLAIASVLAVTSGTVSVQALSVTAPASATFGGKTVSTTEQTDTAVIGNNAADAAGIGVVADVASWSCVMTVTHLTTIAPVKTVAGSTTITTTGGKYDGTYGVTDPPRYYEVKIIVGGAVVTATYQWKIDGGSWSATAPTAATVTLEKGVKVNFDFAGAYVAGDAWTFAVDVFPYTSLTATPARLFAVGGVTTGVTVGSTGLVLGTAATSDAKTLMTAVSAALDTYYIDVDLSQTIHANSLAGTYASVATITVT